VIAATILGVRQDAEDVAQEACATVLKKYKKESFTVSFETWALGVLKKKVMEYRRKLRRRAREVASDTDTAGPRQAIEPEPRHLLKIRLVDCAKKLVRKHPRYARVVNLVYQGYKTDEVCRRLRITPNNMYVTLSRGRSALAGCLETGKI
jgi:RNA polymerase sigma factor (sigma-70 family)